MRMLEPVTPHVSIADLGAIGVTLLALDAAHRGELVRGDFLDHVREEIEVSRTRVPDILQPTDALHRAADALGEAMRQTGADQASRCAFKQRCAEIAALAARLACEGSAAFPATQPDYRGAGR